MIEEKEINQYISRISPLKFPEQWLLGSYPADSVVLMDVAPSHSTDSHHHQTPEARGWFLTRQNSSHIYSNFTFTSVKLLLCGVGRQVYDE